MKRIVWIVVAVAVLGLAWWTLLPSAVPVRIETVATGTVHAYVDERGTTRLREEHALTMPTSARLARLEVQEGDLVAAGQVVARLVESDVAESVTQAKLAVAQIEARIRENDDNTVEKTGVEQAELYVESMASTVAAAEARKEAGKSQLDYAETQLGRIRKLQATGAASRDELDRAELAFIQAQIDYSQDVLTAESMRSLQAATKLMPRMLIEYMARKGNTRAVLEQELADAQSRLRLALVQEQRSVLTSPVDGVILTRTDASERFRPAGEVVVTIGRWQDLEIELDVLSEDAGRIRSGQVAIVYGPAVGVDVSAGIEGVVDRVFPAGFTKLSSLGVEQQRVKVVVRMADEICQSLWTERRLGVDYRVRARIVTQEANNVTSVVRSAISYDAAGQPYVFVVRQGAAQRQPVSIGVQNDDHVEIVTGLSSGDSVIASPDDRIADGVRVVPE